MIGISRNEWLPKKTKILIATLYKNTNKSYSQIGNFLDVHKTTVSKYKNYRIPGATKDVHTMYIQKEQDVFQEFYDECMKGNRFYPESVSLFLVHGAKGDKKYRYLRKFEKLPRYKNKSRQEIINDVADIVFRNYKGGHDKVILPPI